jgi:lycopene cyclase domain-containing protein
MKSEYLILNIIILCGPLFLSFDQKVHFFSRWKDAFMSITIVMIPFIIWDVAVTGRHWWFNSLYTLNYRLAGLPLEEWLFFITVPFAILFIWEIFHKRIGNPIQPRLRFIRKILLVLFIPGLLMFIFNKEYTGLTLCFLGFAGLVDTVFRTEVLARKFTLAYLSLIAILILIFNGYLTARPVVLYNPEYQLNLRIFSIPFEDFGYGFSLILLNTAFFEKLRGSKNA